MALVPACVGTQLKYAPFASSVDVGFWYTFNKKKLEEYKLNTDPVCLRGGYVNTEDQGQAPRLSILYSAFARPANETSSPGMFSCPGVLLHTNTVEEFKSCNRKELLNSIADERLYQHMLSGKALDEPQILATFIVHLFADLKKYHYIYWFAFPAFISHKETIEEPIKTLEEYWTKEQMEIFTQGYLTIESDVNPGFFVLEQPSEECFCFHPLRDYGKLLEEQRQVCLGVADPSSIGGVPGWPLRNLLTLAHLQWPSHSSHKVLCLRMSVRRGERSVSHSLIFRVRLEPRENATDLTPCVGWEKDGAGNLAPIKLDLSASMDPEKVCDSACELTLQLMRWRVAPALDTHALQKTRCLLLGAGTLGCNVARALMGWGMMHFTFVDSGHVSYSNPVRQSLYSFSDCLGGGQLKAVAAARALKLIRPSVISEGVVLTIPMPGHPPGRHQEQVAVSAVERLQQLIADHDVVFLLTDSRESRWLPALIGASMNKIVITAALGFDSFVVIRHGSKPNHGAAVESCTDLIDYSCKLVPGRHLGCYFCNDVAVPGNSQEDRTLDQQCTVTRPGVSLMAAAQAAELLASLLQHPLRHDAPSGLGSTEGVLGAVPHSVRMFLSSQQLLTPTSPAFKQCSACGQQILAAYEREGTNLILKVLNSSKHLGEVSGIAQLKVPLFGEDLSDSLSETFSISDEEAS
ncbi:ubiquitin-like modifier-activating enzyme ATG7 isoform X2 [Hyalella azteca]|uniref:Ubiquitin-like modifier-activating enzyme ATG7 n=1 Tax=Hyalella azteca TaxID=294128 RepID=A0A8B7N2L2_HYAAZ|nr:ubiquitin-like modifier-activating enzyme ATG7 isoform X2 [Hyalella azteca]